MNFLHITSTSTGVTHLPPPTLPWCLTCTWEQWPHLLHSTTFHCQQVLSQATHLSLHPHYLDAWLTYGNSGHSNITIQRSFVDFSRRRATDEDRRCGRKFWTIFIFYWSNCFLNCPSLFYLVFYLLQSITRYLVYHLERLTYHFVYIYTYIVMRRTF